MKIKNPYEVMMPLNFPDEGMGNIILDDKDNTETIIEEEEEDDKENEGEEDKNKEKEVEEEEEDKELVLTRVEYKDITGKFPNLFKEFPDLKEAFFREQQFTELFPTVEEAKKAAEAQTAYEEITAAVVEGDAQKFIDELKNESADGLESFAKSFIPALRESNRDLYLDVITPSVQQFVKNVYTHGVKEKDSNIQNAAKLVHKVLFGGDYNDIEGDISLVNKDRGKKDDKVEEDKQRYFTQKYNALYTDVTNVCYSKLDEEINKGLDDLGKSNPGMKRIIAKEIKNQVLSKLEEDSLHLSRMQGLWKREQRNGFQGSLKNSIVATFLGKAKTLVPKIRVEVRKEVLGKTDKGGEKEVTRLSGGRESRGGQKKMTAERAREEKLTTKGIFDAD